MIVISSDHGENLGELNQYGDHGTADEGTGRVPLIIQWPGGTKATTCDALIHQFDLAPTLLELAGVPVPPLWDAVSAAPAVRGDAPFHGRSYLVFGIALWTCQRSVRFNLAGRRWLYIHTRHDGWHEYPEHMLFDVGVDSHEQNDLAEHEPATLAHARQLLKQWRADQRERHAGREDPMDMVMEPGGHGDPPALKNRLDRYTARLRATGRAAVATRLETRPQPFATPR